MFYYVDEKLNSSKCYACQKRRCIHSIDCKPQFIFLKTVKTIGSGLQTCNAKFNECCTESVKSHHLDLHQDHGETLCAICQNEGHPQTSSSYQEPYRKYTIAYPGLHHKVLVLLKLSVKKGYAIVDLSHILWLRETCGLV